MNNKQVSISYFTSSLPQGFEPRVSCLQERHAKHYTTAAYTMKHISVTLRHSWVESKGLVSQDEHLPPVCQNGRSYSLYRDVVMTWWQAWGSAPSWLWGNSLYSVLEDWSDRTCSKVKLAKVDTSESIKRTSKVFYLPSAIVQFKHVGIFYSSISKHRNFGIFLLSYQHLRRFHSNVKLHRKQA